MNNNMFITSQGLRKVSRRLIAKSLFDRKLIEEVGTPIIIEGIASSFSSSNYVRINNLDFTDSNYISIDFKGTFTANQGDECCLWELLGSKAPVNVGISIIDGNLYVKRGNEYSEGYPLYIQNNDKLQVKISLNSGNYECLIFVNEKSYQYSGKFDEGIVLQLFDRCEIGGTQSYWQGSVDLNLFRIWKDSDIYFSPSINNEFVFTDVLLSDGSTALSDSSKPILNHIMECKVDEITRNENNLLLKVTIGSNINMTIQEIGLYSDSRDGRQLFSLIQGLKISKSSSVGYSLIIHVSLDINVVNTSVIPEIVVNEKKEAKYREFQRIKEDYAYVITLLERMIKTNSLGINGYKTKDNFIFPYPSTSYSIISTTKNPVGLDIEPKVLIEQKPSWLGYNRAQECYRLQKDIMQWKESYNTSWVYSNLKERFTKKLVTHPKYDKLTLEGDVLLSNGDLTSFSRSSYGICKGILDRMDRFNLSVSFYPYSNTSGTILCVSNDSIEQPLTLHLINGRLTCTLGKQDVVKTVGTVEGYELVSDSFYRTSQSVTNDQGTFYEWTYLGRDSLNDENLKVLNTIYTKDTYNPTTSSEVYVMEDSGDHFTLCNNLHISSIYSGILRQETLLSVNNNLYTVNISYDGNKYKFNIYEKSGASVSKEFYSGYSIGYCKDLLIGVTKDSSGNITDPLDGRVQLNNTYLETQGTETNFISSVITNLTELKDFYHIPYCDYNSFKVSNIETNKKSYDLSINDGALTGGRTLVKIDSASNYTLCVKVHLKGLKSRTILACINSLIRSTEFKLEFIINEDRSSKLVFTSSSGAFLERAFNEIETMEFVNYACLLIVSRDGNSYTLYKNKELLSRGILKASESSGEAYLTNYAIDEVAQENVISDILTLSRAVTEDDLYYICSALDTNF